MKYHIYDPVTFIYVETVEADNPPSNSVGGDLPDLTEFYTVAYIDNTWVSTIRPQYEASSSGEIVLKPELQEEIDQEKQAQEAAILLTKNAIKTKLEDLGFVESEIKMMIGI